MVQSHADIARALAVLDPDARVRTLREAVAQVQKRNAWRKYPTPGDLAVALDRRTVQTPALRLVDSAVTRAVKNGGRVAISIPPQEGKSTRVAVWTPVWALMRDPDCRVVTASYEQSLAMRNAFQAREIVAEHGSDAVDDVTGAALPDALGISLARDHRQKQSWSVKAHEGGYFSVGVGGALTGRASDLLLIDDPFKNMQQADSAREREKVWEWWTSVAQTRLAPGAAVVIIMTRWSEDDLVGRLRKQEDALPPGEREWEFLNIPAVAEDGVQDDLRRTPGEWLESARGRTGEEFARIRRNVGERVWSALYQGQPTPNEGGLFKRAEFDQARVEHADLAGRIVSVDPAESGRGDEAGIMLMGWDHDGIMYVEEDHSGRMTSESWARTAVRLAIQHRAADLVFEAFTAETTYRDVLTQTWQSIHRQAQLLRECDGDTVVAAERWYQEGHRGDTLGPMQETLEQIDLIPVEDHMPFRLVPWRKKGDKVARAAGARQSVATGRLRMIGHHRVLENQSITWQPGQGSPDRVDAMVNGHDHMSTLFGHVAQVAVPQW